MKSGKMRGYQIQNYCQLLLTLSPPDLINLVILTTVCYILD